jgi:hypothetical protein
MNLDFYLLHGLFFYPETGSRRFLHNHTYTLKYIHGITSQKTATFDVLEICHVFLAKSNESSLLKDRKVMVCG